MSSSYPARWARLASPLAVALCPAVAWAHGGLDGLGVVLVGVFLGIPFAISMVVGSGACALILWKKWYGRRAAVVGRVLMVAAVVEVVAQPLAAFLVEHRFTGDSATYAAAFAVPLAVLATPCFLLARLVVRRSKAASATS
jgi:hypothetical protein